MSRCSSERDSSSQVSLHVKKTVADLRYFQVHATRTAQCKHTARYAAHMLAYRHCACHSIAVNSDYLLHQTLSLLWMPHINHHNSTQLPTKHVIFSQQHPSDSPSQSHPSPKHESLSPSQTRTSSLLTAAHPSPPAVIGVTLTNPGLYDSSSQRYTADPSVPERQRSRQVRLRGGPWDIVTHD